MDKRIFFSIQNRLYNKNFNKQTLERSIRTMKSAIRENPDDFRYLKLLANLYIENEEYYEAQKIFLKMKDIDETSASVYYGLYKIDILIDDDESLLYDLGDYEYFCKENTKALDLYFDLTNLYLDVKEGKDDKTYEFKYDGNLHSNEVTDKEIDSNIKEAIKNLKEKNYLKALLHFQKCVKINEENNYCLSIYPLYSLIDKICNIKKVLYKETKKELLKEKNYDEYIKLLNYELDNDYKSGEIYEELRVIDKLIDLRKIKEAKELLDKIKELEVTNRYNKIINYLYNKINDINDMNEEFEETKGYAELYESKKQNLKALDLYFAELKNTDKNIYNYYIGILFFKAKYYSEAFLYFNKYTENGGLQLSNALLYMSIILGLHGNQYLARRVIRRCKEIYLFKGQDYDSILTEASKYYYEDPSMKSEKQIIKLTLNHINDNQ